MKKATVVLLVLLMMVGFYVLGAMSVLHSEGWIDEERGEFVVEWMDNIWTWDISEG